MRTTAGTTSPSVLAATADSYRDRGSLVSTTANGISLITDAAVCGIELPEELAEGVHAFMQANGLVGPVITLPGATNREIHLVTGVAKATMALEALRKLGAIIYQDGAGIPLPPTQLSAGSARWAIAPEDCRWTPPVVALAAAVRATTSRRWTARSASVAC